MDTVKYTLRSNPGLVVDAPLEYARKANELLVQSSMSAEAYCREAVNHSFLCNPGVFMSFLSVYQSESSERRHLTLQDDFVLRVCIAGLDSMLEDEAAATMRERLIEVSRRISA